MGIINHTYLIHNMLVCAMSALLYVISAQYYTHLTLGCQVPHNYTCQYASVITHTVRLQVIGHLDLKHIF